MDSVKAAFVVEVGCKVFDSRLLLLARLTKGTAASRSSVVGLDRSIVEVDVIFAMVVLLVAEKVYGRSYGFVSDIQEGTADRDAPWKSKVNEARSVLVYVVPPPLKLPDWLLSQVPE